MEFIRAKKASLSLDMAPLIDVVFQLLIFFMLSSSFLAPALKLNLPRAASRDVKELEQVVVSIDRDGEVFLDTRRTSMGNLKSALEAVLRKGSKKVVHVRGDSQMPYRYFVQAMDRARQAGARQIQIVHEPEVVG